MSAQTVLTDLLYLIELDLPNAQLSDNSYEVNQIKTLMNLAGADIASRVQWSSLFTTWLVAAGASAEVLPVDFKKITETGSVIINDDTFTPLLNVIAPEQWAFLQKTPSKQGYYHLAEGEMQFIPNVPEQGVNVRYLSSFWVKGKPNITQNSDTFFIPETLITKGAAWRWKRQKSLPYDDLLAEFEADLITEINADRGQG